MLQIHLIGILCQFLPTNKNKDIIRLWKDYYLVLTSKVQSWQRSLYIIQSFSILQKVSFPRYSSPVLTHGLKKQTQLGSRNFCVPWHNMPLDQRHLKSPLHVGFYYRSLETKQKQICFIRKAWKEFQQVLEIESIKRTQICPKSNINSKKCHPLH